MIMMKYSERGGLLPPLRCHLTTKLAQLLNVRQPRNVEWIQHSLLSTPTSGIVPPYYVY